MMQEFFQHAKDSDYLKQDDKDFLRKLQATAQKGVSMLQVRHDNLEEILSFCLASENFKAGYATQSDSKYNRLCHILHEVYRRIDLKEWNSNNGLLDNVRKFLGIRKKDRPTGENFTFITTNYDVMIELCVARLGMNCKLPGKWSVVPKAETEMHAGMLYASNHHGPLLCKLHGSLNWFVGLDDKELKIENEILSADYMNNTFENKPIALPKVSCEKYEPIATPLIIPPTLFKMQTEPYFREIWNTAGQALQQAEKLVFVGFSFPESDTYIKYFLGANLHENVDLRTIQIVDPNADEICRKLKESNFGIHFKKRLKGNKGKWEETNYCVVD